jgi:hypothetical protein
MVFLITFSATGYLPFFLRSSVVRNCSKYIISFLFSISSDGKWENSPIRALYHSNVDRSKQYWTNLKMRLHGTDKGMPFVFLSESYAAEGSPRPIGSVFRAI